MKILNNFQILIGNINRLGPTIGIITYELSNLFQTSQEDSNSNNQDVKQLKQKKFTFVERRLQNVYVDGIDSKLDCILVILSSTHSPTGLIMQRQDSIMEWIFFS